VHYGKSANKRKLAGEVVSQATYHNAGGEDDNGVKYFVVRFQVISQNSLCNLIYLFIYLFVMTACSLKAMAL